MWGASFPGFKPAYRVYQGGPLFRFVQENMLPLLNKKRTVFVKPPWGGGGRDAFALTKSGKSIELRTSKGRGAKKKPERVFDFTDATDGARKLTEFLHEAFPKKGQNVKPFIVQAEIPHLKYPKDGWRAPMEIRFIMQRTQEGYAATFHYAKIGANAVAANIEQGGTPLESKNALIEALQAWRPKVPRAVHARHAQDFLEKAEKLARKVMDRNPLHRRPTQVKINVLDNEYLIHAAPILATVDIVALPTRKGLKPAVMEQHSRGNFKIRKHIKSGFIPPQKWAAMRALHEQNLELIHKEAQQLIGN